tara:strand:+ start:41 stop:622 length:582 start_codon:yes stop_codon:yes gene_type:complete
MLPYIITIVIFLNSCGILPSNNEEKFEPVFTAEINGEPYDARAINGKLTAKAVLTDQGEYLYLTIFGYEYDPQFYPYNEFVGFSMNYSEGISEYPAILDTITAGRNLYLGGNYYEVNGDATISVYEAKNDTQGHVTVNFEPQKKGKTIVSGTFEMRVIVNRRADQYSLRVNQDTLYITNGKYRLKLDDRTEDD